MTAMRGQDEVRQMAALAGCELELTRLCCPFAALLRIPVNLNDVFDDLNSQLGASDK